MPISTRPLLILSLDYYPGMCNSYFAYIHIKAFAAELDSNPSICFLGEKPEQSSSCSLDSRSWRKLVYSLLYPLKILLCAIPSISPLFQKYYFNPEHGGSLLDRFIRSPAKIVVLRGWGFADLQLLERHRDKLLLDMGIISPKTNNHQISPPKTKTLGVHIRRKDYKQFLNGRFYFSHTTYLSWIDHARTLIGDVEIIFFSNDPTYVAEHLREHGRIFNGTAKEDLAMLSHCDYILGPPSTFSMWASFIGHKPAMHMYQYRPTPTDTFVPWQKLLAYNACIDKCTRE